jgi:hypothetical protein
VKILPAVVLGLVSLGAPLGAASTGFADAPHIQAAPQGHWSMELKLGAALPLGSLAQYAQAGPAVSLDAVYQTASDFDVDVFALYTTQSYSVAWGAQPLSNLGLGVKLLYDLGEQNGIRWSAGAGVAGFYNQRSDRVLHQPAVVGKESFDPSPDSSLGLGVLATLAGRYAFTRRLSLCAELNLISINLAGGSSDTLVQALPLAGLNFQL